MSVKVDCRTWIAGAHEAGHALAAAVLGVKGIRVALGSDGSGGHVCHDPVPIRCEADARREMIILWAGEMAERLLIPEHVREQYFSHSRRDVGAESDPAIMIALAAKWCPAGRDAVAWSKVARQRALGLLTANLKTLQELRERVESRGFSPVGPLIDVVKIDQSWARPF